ncbi:MAG: methyltransferase domain-containing protein [Gammaproteobacteria bacterium]
MPPSCSEAVTAGDYPADLYAAVHGGNPGDLDWYRAACAGAASVLELGCGSGRVGGALAAGGHAVTGIDLNRGALALAAAAGVEAVFADMQSFELGRQFERILIPYNGLYCLLDDAAVLACLRAVARHLAPGGRLLLDVWAADAIDFAAAAAADGPACHVAAVDVSGRTWDVWETTATDAAARRLDVTYEHVPRGGGTAVTATISQRALTSEEIVVLLDRAGLELAELRGGFHGESFGPDSALCVLGAVRR